MSASSEANGGRAVTVVMLPADLHARPAGQVARAVSDSPALVTLVLGDRQADARSVLAVMGLGARQGEAVTVTGEGPSAADAVAAVAAVLAASADSEGSPDPHAVAGPTRQAGGAAPSCASAPAMSETPQ